MVVEEYLVERERQRLKRLLPYGWLQLTLPYRDAMPSHLGKPLLLLAVALAVVLYLGLPEGCVGLGQTIILATRVSSSLYQF